MTIQPRDSTLRKPGFLLALGMFFAVIGLIHLNPWQFVPATLLGVLFAWFLLRTGSLVPCLVGHALH